MGLRDAFRGFWGGLRKGEMIPVGYGNSKPSSMTSGRTASKNAGLISVKSGNTEIKVIPGLGQLEVADTMQNPTQANVPGSWGRAWLGPGQPFTPLDAGQTARDKDKTNEPRSFQYITGINSTISPRIAYGLLPFTDLRNFAETVPEVSMCLRLLTEELKAFVPLIVDEKDNVVKDSEYDWMTTRPDRFNPMPVWLSRFMYNVEVYDAGCSYLIRDEENKIVGSRVIDGSTIFVVIDERGEQPMPPAPAFTQVIWGVPKQFLNTYQLWYKPRHLRADAPYGRSPIEDSLQSVKLLANLWEYELDKYQVGNIPEMIFTVPENWGQSPDEILEFESAFNARMAGNSEERVRARFLPAGVTAINTKELSFNKESYDAAVNAVRMSFGIPQSEFGETPTGGLGGSGYQESMQSAFYRMGLAPLIVYIEGHFNDILEMNGCTNLKFKMELPPESLDPTKEEEKWSTRFQIGGVKRDEYRVGLGMTALHGEEGDFIVTPGGGMGDEGDLGGDGMNPFGGGDNNGKPPAGGKLAVLKKPVRVSGKPVAVARKLEVKKVSDGDDASLEFQMGLDEEMEHYDTVGGDIETVVRIVLDHLKEDPHYYSKLKAAFGQPEPVQTQPVQPQQADPLQKDCGVDPEDDEYFGVKVSHELPVNMPHQGANDSRIVSIGGFGGLAARAAVWKPQSGEKKSLQDWVGGDLYKRAEACYLVDREIAPDENHYLVPVTWIDEVDGEVGSVQHYVQGRGGRQEVTTYSPEWVEQCAVFDYITGQVDRVHNNWVTHPEDDKRPIMIDNDLSFPTKLDQHVHSGWVNIMLNKPLSDTMIERVYLLVGNRDLWDDILDCLGDKDAVAGAQARAKKLLDDKAINMEKPLSVSKLQKVDWDSAKHPKDKKGQFAPKGGGGEMAEKIIITMDNETDDDWLKHTPAGIEEHGVTLISNIMMADDDEEEAATTSVPDKQVKKGKE